MWGCLPQLLGRASEWQWDPMLHLQRGLEGSVSVASTLYGPSSPSLTPAWHPYLSGSLGRLLAWCMKRVRGCVHGVTLTVHPRTSIRCPLSAWSLQASLSESILLLKTKGLPAFTLALMPGSRDLREANGDRFALATCFRSLRLVWQGARWLQHYCPWMGR